MIPKASTECPIDFGPTKLGRIRQLTEELNSDELAVHLFFKLAPDLLCIADENGYFVKINAAWNLMLGWSNEELYSNPIKYFVHPDDIDLYNNINQMLERQEIARFHCRFRRKEGTKNQIDYPSGPAAGPDEYIALEWSTTTWHNGLTYAVARQPVKCCQNQKENP